VAVVIAPGEMGAAVGRRLRERGATVRTSLAGRSAASAERVRRAGIEAVHDDAALVAGAGIVLSIVPPGEAVALAERLAPALRDLPVGAKPVYVDCNAVSPETVRRVADRLAGTGCAFLDAGIVGAPPQGDDAGPRLYVSGEPEALPSVLALREYGLDVRPLDGGIGAASALKMAYATVTKGLTALGTAMMLSAEADRGGGGASVAASLRAELAVSQPMLLAWLSRQVPGMLPKAYRWVAEMEEISRFLDDPGGSRMLSGAARLYERIAAAHRAEAGSPGAAAQDDDVLDRLRRFLNRGGQAD
jgi:3-hydroxyisobutyrate dehydrogenase-like beta-hydroxyacid dehydrogenase